MLGVFFSSQQNLQKANTDAELLQDTIDFTLSHQLQINFAAVYKTLVLF